MRIRSLNKLNNESMSVLQVLKNPKRFKQRDWPQDRRTGFVGAELAEIGVSQQGADTLWNCRDVTCRGGGVRHHQCWEHGLWSVRFK